MEQKSNRAVHVSAIEGECFAIERIESDEMENRDLVTSALSIQTILYDSGLRKYVDRGLMTDDELAKTYNPRNPILISDQVAAIHYPDKFWLAYGCHDDESIKTSHETGYNKKRPLGYAKTRSQSVNEISVETVDGSLVGSYEKHAAALLSLALSETRPDVIVSSKVDVIDNDRQEWYQDLGFVRDEDYKETLSIGGKEIELARFLCTSAQKIIEKIKLTHVDLNIS